MNDLTISVITNVLLGFMLGVACSALCLYFYAKHAMKKKLLEDEAKARAQKIESVNERLNQVKELTRKQLTIQSEMESPKFSSLDAKYKMSLIEVIGELEINKNNILQSILDDGFDPSVSVMQNDGTPLPMKLSEFVALTTKAPPVETLPEVPLEYEGPKPRQVGKFTVYSGSKKGDDTTH